MGREEKRRKGRCSDCTAHRRQIRGLERRVKELEEENAKLRARVDEVERAGKRQAGPFSKNKPKANPKRPGRKAGADYGKRHFRPPPEQVDEVIDVPLSEDCCENCGGPLVNERVADQYVTDLPPVKPRTTQFRVHSAKCARCGRRVQGRHPRQVSDALGAASCQIGANAIGLAAHLNKASGMTYGKISSLFESAFNFSVAPATVNRALARLSKKARPLYERICCLVRRSDVVYCDETGWRINGQKAWLWTFVSLGSRATVYVIRKSRGSDVAIEILGEDFDGILGRDGWQVYNRFKDALHQICIGHFLHRAKSLIETLPSGQALFATLLKMILASALLLRDRFREETISEHGLRVAKGRLETRLDRLLEESYAHSEIEKFANHVAYHREDVFTFLDIPEVEATNWPAEQSIRPAVINRVLSVGVYESSGAVGVPSGDRSPLVGGVRYGETTGTAERGVAGCV